MSDDLDSKKAGTDAHRDARVDNVTPFRSSKDIEEPVERNTPSEPMFNIPPVTKALSLFLIAINVLLYVLFPPALTEQIIAFCSFIPARYTGLLPFDLSAVVSPILHLFIHGGWMHLAMNVGMLLAFGAALENAMGVRKYLTLYFLSGLIGTLTHFVFFSESATYLIGASGAISGLFGAVLLLMQYSGMLGEGRGKKQLLFLCAIWIGISAFFGYFGMPGTDANVAWTVHIGGFLAGMALCRPVLRYVK